MSEVVFFLEEASARAMLEGLLPRLLPNHSTWRFVVFEGKQDLDRRLERRLRGYLAPDALFVILRDKDAADCVETKRSLRSKCEAAGKPEALVRIACHELESWYLADLRAVEQGLGIEGLGELQKTAKYRSPDNLANAAQELEKLTQGVYQKIAGSRDIGPHLDVENLRSPSFAVFVRGIRRLFAARNSPPSG